MGEEYLSAKRYDKEGYEICPEHGERMYGWKSPNIQHPGGQTLTDWSKMGGDGKLKLDTSSPDRRIEKIDGTQVLAERAARRNGGSNGDAGSHSLREDEPTSGSGWAERPELGNDDGYPY